MQAILKATVATKESIIVLPNGHLRTRSKKVTVIDDEVVRVIEDMKNATLDWEDSRPHEVGVALAAIQIDQPYKLVVIRRDFENKGNRSFDVLINPTITKLEGDVEEDYEGCLSATDVYGKVPRYSKVRVRALNEQGQEIRIKADGFLARVLQHEIDHTNGKMFVDHIKDKPELFYRLTESGKLKKLSQDEYQALDLFR
jgi:peptide deformylase